MKQFMNSACPQLFLSKNFLDGIYRVQAIKKMRTNVGIKRQATPSIQNKRYVVNAGRDDNPKSAKYYKIIVLNEENNQQTIIMHGYSPKDYDMADSFVNFFNMNLHEYFNVDLKIIIDGWMRKNHLKGY